MNSTTLRRPTVAMLAAAGRTRALIVVAVTTLCVGLLLVAASIARLRGGGPQPVTCTGSGECTASSGFAHSERLANVVTDPGTRGGAIFALVLMCIPLALLAVQAVKLGSSDRERRYGVLAIAGATRRDLLGWATLEVLAPAAVGGVGGVGFWLLLRRLLGGSHFSLGGEGGLVPEHTGPGWWSLLVLAVVLGIAAWTGARAGGRAADAWLHAKGLRRAPTWWGPMALLAAVVVSIGVASMIQFPSVGETMNQVVVIGLILLLVGGLAVASPRFAWGIANRLATRSSRAEVLLAARRLAADPYPAARAAAAAGATGFAGSVAVLMVAAWYGANSDPAGVILAWACTVAIGVAMVIVALSVAVRSAEAVAERRREIASLVATGVPERLIVDSLAIEARIVALPMTVLGACLAPLLVMEPNLAWFAPVAILAVASVMAASIWAASRAVAPVVRRALVPSQLRTE